MEQNRIRLLEKFDRNYTRRMGTDAVGGCIPFSQREAHERRHAILMSDRQILYGLAPYA